MRVIIIAALLGECFCLLASSSLLFADTPPLTLEAAASQALAQSQELAALRARIEAAEAMVAPAGALPDPMVTVGLRSIPVGAGLALDQDTMSGLTLMLSQDVPPREQRRVQSQAQREEAEMLRAQYDEARNDLVRRVRQAYVEVQYRDTARALAQQNKDLARDMLALAEAKYSVGKSMQADVFLAQLRLSEMVDMTIMQEKERAMAATRLNRLRYRPPTEAVSVTPLVASQADLDLDSLPQTALAQNPKLKAMTIAVTRAGTLERRAASMLKPMWTFSFEYMIREQVAMDPMSGDDMWSATAGLTLPWIFRKEKTDQEVRGAQAERIATESDLAAMRNELSGMVEEMLLDVHRADEQLALLDTGLLPQAESAYAAARAAYAATAGPMLELLEAQMNLKNLHLQRAVLISGRERSLAELSYLTGAAAANQAAQEADSEGN